MTVNTTLARTAHNGDGVSQNFTIPFYFLQDGDLLIFVDGTQQTLTTNYSVTGAGNASGGAIVFVTAPPAGSGNVVIIRDPDLLQSTNYPPNDPFPAKTHETALDKLTMLAQRTRDLIARSFTFADADTSGASVVVPTPQPDFLLGWNADGSGLANYAAIGDAAAAPVPFPVAIGGTGAADVPTARANLGVGGLADNNTWSGTQTFRDANLSITDDADPSKKLALEVAGVTPGATRTLSVPDKNGTLALLSDIPAQNILPPVRQSVLGGATDANGYANWLSAGTGLTVNLSAAASAVRLAFASGYSDLLTDLTADQANAFGTLPANNTSFLYADRTGTGSITGGNTLVPPQYGYSFDRTRAALLHFDGVVGNTNILDDWGNTWTAQGSAKLQSNQTKFGGTALGGGGTANALNGSTDYVKTTAIASLGGGSWAMRCWVYPTSVPGSTIVNCFVAATTATGSIAAASLSIYNPGGGPKFVFDISSNGSSEDVATAGSAIGTTTVLANTWYFVELTYDALASVYRLYVNGVQEAFVASALRACAFASVTIGAGIRGASAITFFTGYVDEFEAFSCCDHPNGASYSSALPSTPSNVNSAGKVSCWFDIPNMTMREVIAPSISAGTNPVFTSRTRLFVGEGDANGTGVTAVRNYAYNGRFHASNISVPGANTRVPITHNLGGNNEYHQMDAKVKFSSSFSGWPAGAVAQVWSNANNTNGAGADARALETANVAAILSSGNGLHVVNAEQTSPSGYVQVPAGTGTASISVDIRRGWGGA